ncbi:hypothetical protein GCM10027093_69440 [Paraburkholderia jirisanensis]
MITSTKQDVPTHDPYDRHSTNPIERANRCPESQHNHEGSNERNGTVEQKLHDGTDETLPPRGEDRPEKAPSTPDHDQLDPALQPDPQAPGVPQPPPGATRRT